MVTRPAWVHLASLHSKSLEGTSKANLETESQTLWEGALENTLQAPLLLGRVFPQRLLHLES